jgi:hypothetical protein
MLWSAEKILQTYKARWKVEGAPQAHKKEVCNELTDCEKAA